MARNRLFIVVPAVSIVLISAVSWGGSRDKVRIVPSRGADVIERLAASELADLLGRMYPGSSFAVSRKPGSSRDRCIFLGTRENPGRTRLLVGADELSQPGSFVVKRGTGGESNVAVIAGADSRAVLDGVYGLLEEMGCGFCLSHNHVPEYSREEFGFERFDLKDAPVYGERIVFDWHNFLSSCSTWNLAEWKQWIAQAGRMRYSSVMIHAYGNNPIVSYTYKGQTKPVGYLSTTARGRDWGTQHVNDVRRLHGGREIFDEQVFGADAAKVSDGARVGAARRLMKEVFAYAEDRGMDVTFALDVDTASSNPANVITALPVGARFESGGHWLARPDTAEGYAFYETQAESLLGDYPQIDKLIVWYRSGRTPWRGVKVEDFPYAWKKEYEARLAESPRAKELKDSPSMFAIAKIVRAFRKALDEMGRRDVGLGIGTWHFGTLEAADLFMPGEVGFYPLDWSVIFEKEQTKRTLAAVGANRRMIPIVWAHHDDHRYMGRPYTPYSNFASQLGRCKAAGFGIIHWTTRPLDIYFKSLGRQVWLRSENETIERTCSDIARRTFGPQHQGMMAKYLLDWVTDGPQFGRETTDRLIDRPLDEPQKTIELCKKRLALLDSIRSSSFTWEQRGWFAYCRLMEQFYIGFYENEGRLQESMGLLKMGDAEGARAAIAGCRPEDVIALYSRACQMGEISRGEMAMVVSMNLRWLPYFEAQSTTRWPRVWGIERSMWTPTGTSGWGWARRKRACRLTAMSSRRRRHGRRRR